MTVRANRNETSHSFLTVHPGSSRMATQRTETGNVTCYGGR